MGTNRCVTCGLPLGLQSTCPVCERAHLVYGQARNDADLVILEKRVSNLEKLVEKLLAERAQGSDD